MGGIIFVIGIMGINGFLQEKLWEAQHQRYYAEDQISGIIPEGKYVRPTSIGFELFLADLFWLKTVQYIGGNIFDARPALYPFVNLVTDLDPRFTKAYEMGTTFLEIDGDFEHAKALYTKYQKNVPDDWNAYYKAAYLYFYYLEDYESAIWNYEQCLQKTGCIAGAERLLRVTQTRSGKYAVALDTWTKVLQNPATSEEDRKLAKLRIEEASELWLLNTATVQYEATGKTITSLSDFVGFTFTAPHGKQVIGDENMITSPFENNPYQWDAQKKRVRTKLF